jgi:hypothetical protein
LVKIDKEDKSVYKVFRHLPKNTNKEFHDKSYRYLVDLDKLNITKKIKSEIRAKMEKV